MFIKKNRTVRVLLITSKSTWRETVSKRKTKKVIVQFTHCSLTSAGGGLTKLLSFYFLYWSFSWLTGCNFVFHCSHSIGDGPFWPGLRLNSYYLHFRYHLSEILATIVNEYTDWERPVQHPINIRDETLEALSDAQYVAPVVHTADLHSSARRNSYLYVFDYQTKFGDYQQVPYVIILIILLNLY